MGIRNQKIVTLPPFRSAALHQNANPLPVNNIPAFGQDTKPMADIVKILIYTVATLEFTGNIQLFRSKVKSKI